ncbi:hypothetical protein [Streptomyces sp. NPDC048392]
MSSRSASTAPGQSRRAWSSESRNSSRAEVFCMTAMLPRIAATT